MDKRRIIIREIEHWRRSRLLPEQYCDFLMNLYADESAAGVERRNRQRALATIRSSHWKSWAIAFTVLTLLAILVLYFTAFPLPMQIGVFAAGTLLAYAIGIAYGKDRLTIAYPAIGLGSLLALIAGPCLMLLHDAAEPVYIGMYIALCCLLWIVQGIVLRMGLFHFCGWIGLCAVYAWTIYAQLEPMHWAFTQLMWIPLSVMFIWMTWLLHGKSKRVARVLLLVAVVQWFIPDVMANGFYESTATVQLALLVKTAAFVMFMFLWRNKWTEWVA